MTTTNSILAASKPARKLCCPSACTTAACCSGVGQLSRGKLCAFLLMPASNPARTMATSCSVVDMPTTTTTTGTCVPYEKKSNNNTPFTHHQNSSPSSGSSVRRSRGVRRRHNCCGSLRHRGRRTRRKIGPVGAGEHGGQNPCQQRVLGYGSVVVGFVPLAHSNHDTLLIESLQCERGLVVARKMLRDIVERIEQRGS
jgi:hypothetical protein